MRLLFLGHLLRGAAQQSVGLFLPVFLFLLGKNATFFREIPFVSQASDVTQGVITVALFYISYRICVFVLAIPIARIMRSMGLMKSMMLGNMFMLLSYLSLSFSTQQPTLLLFVPILFAIETLLYWVAYYTQFSIRSDFRSLGQEVGALAFMERIVRAALPMAGGVVIGLFGFQTLHLIGALLLLSASLFLLPIKEILVSTDVHFRDFLAWMRKKFSKEIMLSMLGRYMDDGAITLWSVYTLIFLGSAERVGYLYSVILFLSLAIAYFMGWYLGKHRGLKAMYISGSLLSLVWVLRGFVQTLWHIITVDLMDRMAVTVFQPVYDTLLFRISRGKHVFQFYLFREMILSLFGCIFWILISLFFLTSIQWTGVFILGSLGILLSFSIVFGEAK